MEVIYEDSREFLSEYSLYLKEQKASGKKIIGYTAHEFVPDELIRCLNAVPLPLLFAGNEEKTLMGSEYLTPSMCPYALSMLGSISGDGYDNDPVSNILYLLDGIVASNYCAADYLVNEWISNIAHVPLFQFHVPLLNTSAHVNYFTREMHRFADQIRQISEIPVPKLDSEEFSENLQEEYMNNAYLGELLQKVNGLLIPHSDKNKITHLVKLYGPSIELISSLNDFISSKPVIQDLEQVKSQYGAPLLFLGASVFIGDNLFEFIEECGGYVIKDLSWIGFDEKYAFNAGYNHQNGSEDLEVHEKLNSSHDEIFRPLAMQLVCRGNSLHISHATDPIYPYMKIVQETSNATNCTACINHIIKFCDIVGHHRHPMKSSLNDSSLQVLNLERDYSRSMHGQLRTRIEAFIEMIQ